MPRCLNKSFAKTCYLMYALPLRSGRRLNEQSAEHPDLENRPLLNVAEAAERHFVGQ